ncbi:GDSL-type esterase/lipase family protein [Mangrovactinospora gilvigrisea]|nr:GDSL-type esterase/lipase family protein [Mangrovactinospora gilvigrisea]
MVAGCGEGSGAAKASVSSSPSGNAARPAAAELTATAEKTLHTEADALYGAAAKIPSFGKRRTSLIGVGDSEMSGEGLGHYAAGTDGPANYCHRSSSAAINHTGLDVDTVYDLACSGATSADVRAGAKAQYADQRPQAETLAIRARLTRVKAVALMVGANDVNYGSVMADCVTRALRFKQPCQKTYGPGWKARVAAKMPSVAASVRSIQKVMHDAGYLPGDYRLVVMSYPSPLGPGTHGSGTGCLAYSSDGKWARDTADPVLSAGLRGVAQQTGAGFLDLSKAFLGHEACSTKPWVRGVQLELKNRNSMAAGSYHPNATGHRMIARCLGAYFAAAKADGVCTASGTAVRLS